MSRLEGKQGLGDHVARSPDDSPNGVPRLWRDPPSRQVDETLPHPNSAQLDILALEQLVRIQPDAAKIIGGLPSYRGGEIESWGRGVNKTLNCV